MAVSKKTEVQEQNLSLGWNGQETLNPADSRACVNHKGKMADYGRIQRLG
jgi:hypothetical protein